MQAQIAPQLHRTIVRLRVYSNKNCLRELDLSRILRRVDHQPCNAPSNEMRNRLAVTREETINEVARATALKLLGGKTTRS